uniref:Myb/SANT-like domain-containing protein n=1 Tax=Lactuca sativa TaxID=4236 RepID=A0A9R1VWR5_LACSA|nr:hypothetical protein LSAT_V11C400216980 [Lactuca sativa]
MDTSQKQLKNAFDNLKAKYSGNLYNAQTNSFALVNTEWEEFKKSHPKAGSLRTHTLPYPNLCASLCDGGSANSSNKWTSTQTILADTSSSSHCVQRLLIDDNSFNGLEDDDDDASNDTSARAPSDKAYGASTYRSDKRVKTNDASTNRTDSDKASKTSISLDELSLDIHKALQHLVNSKEGPVVEECYERLKLVRLDPMDPIFLASFHLFGMSMNMIEAWMTLSPIPEILKGWIKMTGTTLGMFK